MTSTPARRRAAGAAGASQPSTGRPAGASGAPARRLRVVPPILVRQLRDGFEESIHRGDIVQVDLAGKVLRAIGDPNRTVLVRSAAHPFGVVALIEAGGMESLQLQPAEIAVMAGSHSGEDLHVRTIQSALRRAFLTQALLQCGAEGMPLDPITSARLARDGEKAGPIRHMCSGQHTVALLLCKLGGWDTTGYWLPTHPAQVAILDAQARAFGTTRDRLRLATDSCGLPTFAVTLHDVARAYALLANPAAILTVGADSKDPRAPVAPALALVRDAMMAHPDMVGGARDRIDSSLMKTLPGRLVSKSGQEGLRAAAILPGPRSNGAKAPATGIALKIEDGGANRRAGWAAVTETLIQVGQLDIHGVRALGRYHRPGEHDEEGRMVSEAVAGFDLVPVGELLP